MYSVSSVQYNGYIWSWNELNALNSIAETHIDRAVRETLAVSVLKLQLKHPSNNLCVLSKHASVRL